MAAEESRNVEMILFRRVVHRPLASVLVKSLVGWSPGIVRNRIRGA